MGIHLIKELDQVRICPNCKSNLEDKHFISEFVNDFHYKVFNCKCGEKVFINVDFLGTGHDSWNEEVRQDNTIKTLDDKVKG